MGSPAQAEGWIAGTSPAMTVGRGVRAPGPPVLLAGSRARLVSGEAPHSIPSSEVIPAPTPGSILGWDYRRNIRMGPGSRPGRQGIGGSVPFEHTPRASGAKVGIDAWGERDVSPIVITGLVPVIHGKSRASGRVDCRDKPGNDGGAGCEGVRSAGASCGEQGAAGERGKHHIPFPPPMSSRPPRRDPSWDGIIGAMSGWAPAQGRGDRG